MAWLAEHQGELSSHVDDEDDWGSDFEEELCSQEIEDNRINEIREANFFKSSPKNAQDLNDGNFPAIQTKIGDRSVISTKTGAIPKSGFSYLDSIVNKDANKPVQMIGKESGTNIHPQRQASQLVAQSRNASLNPENSERQQHTHVPTNTDEVTKKAPRKLKPEAFSFLNKLPQRNVTENGNDISKERKGLVPTVFSHAEKLTVSQSLDDTIMTTNESSDMFASKIPSAPPLEITTSNYESITEDSFSECALPPSSNIAGKGNEKPPLPSRPPPVFKYPPETFSSSKPPSTESMSNIAISQPIPQSAPLYPKLNHSISSPDSGLKYASDSTQDRVLSSKEKNRRSLPSAPVCPAKPKRPLPPLPILKTENISRMKLQNRTTKIENSASEEDEKLIEEAPPIHDAISSRQMNQLPLSEVPLQHSPFQETALDEQFISNPQHRLAQILTNQTSVNSAILLSQQKIASAITSRAIGSQSSPTSTLKKTKEPDFENERRPQEFDRMISGRSLENVADQTNDNESEHSNYLETKEAVNPRRFPDPETIINIMNRPLLPQKAAPIQRSVSCNSLVQSIKDLSFSVWSKPEKKRNSDVISVPKKNPKSMSKVKGTAPLSITLIPPDPPSEVTSPPYVESDASIYDELSTLQDYPWFHDVDAKEGQLRLLSVGQDGAFLVRPSSRPTEDIPNTLCILYNRKVRNLHIRRTADGRYLLGNKSSKNFSSLIDMIRHHKEVPVEILPQESTPIKPQIYRILLRETPPKLQKQSAII